MTVSNLTSYVNEKEQERQDLARKMAEFEANPDNKVTLVPTGVSVYNGKKQRGSRTILPRDQDLTDSQWKAHEQYTGVSFFNRGG